MDREIGSDPIVDMFIFETLQLADQLEQLVLTNEKYNSFKLEKINAVFRIMHTIKGSAAMMFYDNISAVAHSVEDLFYYIRENELLELEYSELCDLVLAGIDFIKMETAKIKEGREADGIPEQLLNRIQGYLASLKADEQESLLLTEAGPVIPLNDAGLAPEMEGKLYRTVIFFEDGCEMENIRAFNVISKMEDICRVIRYVPADIAENNDSCCKIREDGFMVEFAAHSTLAELEDFFLSLAFVEGIEIRELAGKAEQAAGFPIGHTPKDTSRQADAAEDACCDHNFNEDQNNNGNVSLKKQSMFIPFSSKLKIITRRETQLKEMILTGILSIQAGDNPRVLREKLTIFLPPETKPRFAGSMEEERNVAR